MSDACVSGGPRADIRVLWMDDHPDAILTIAQLVTEEQLGFSIDVVASIAEARERLTSRRYCGLIVDFRIDNGGPSEHSGAAFLAEVNRQHPDLPTFVYSGFPYDTQFRDHLIHANPVYVADRAEVSWIRPVRDVELIKSIRAYAQAYHEVRDLVPECIRYLDYVAHPGAYQKAVGVHWAKHRICIDRRMRDAGWAWCVACGKRLIAGSNDILDFPDEAELDRLGRTTNLVPFAYSVPALHEVDEAGSIAMAQPSLAAGTGRLHACLRLRIGDTLVVGDFDSRASRTYVSDELIKRGILDAVRSVTTGAHLAEEYRYFTKKIPVTLLVSDGPPCVRPLPVNVVVNWRLSSFVMARSERTILLGQDMLRAFSVEIALDDAGRTTVRSAS